MSDERIVNSKTLYEGSVFDLRLDTVELDGHTYQREIVVHPGAVAMLPFDADGRLILVEQYRAGSNQKMLEIPAGGLTPGEDWEAGARRELQEEIGMIPDTLEVLGDMWVAGSYSTEMIRIFIARGLKPSKLSGDMDERIKVIPMPFEQALEMAHRNEITDSKTLIGLMWAENKRK